VFSEIRDHWAEKTKEFLDSTLDAQKDEATLSVHGRILLETLRSGQNGFL